MTTAAHVIAKTQTQMTAIDENLAKEEVDCENGAKAAQLQSAN